MERSQKILDLLSVKKSMTAEQLCEALFCSPSTLRRELLKLEKTQSIKRVRGGAMLAAGTNFEYSSAFRESVRVKEKEYICGLARDFLTGGMSIFLDSSSTVTHLCPFLDELRGITVVTNGLGTALLLNSCENVDAFLTGGHLTKGSGTVLGEFASGFVDGFKADIAFVSCRGVDEDGLFEANQEQARTKQHMINNAKKVILLADRSKFGYSYFYRLCDFRKVDAVITDSEPSEKIAKAIREQGCELIY